MLESNASSQDQSDFTPANEIENEAVCAFVSAARALDDAGDTAQAELRFRQALRQAITSCGADSADTRSVTAQLAGFYRRYGRADDAVQLEQGQLPKRTLESTFIKRRTSSLDSLAPPVIIVLPPEIRKACQVLGLSPEHAPSPQEVTRAWKHSVVEAAGHPDLGGKTELSILLNTSKDTVLHWLDGKLARIGKCETPLAPR